MSDLGIAMATISYCLIVPVIGTSITGHKKAHTFLKNILTYLAIATVTVLMLKPA